MLSKGTFPFCDIQPRFNETLKSIWKGARKRRPRLGLAISGGSDSMALASLCAAYRTISKADVTLHAFIVDHGLREDSATEADTTVRRLERLG